MTLERKKPIYSFIIVSLILLRRQWLYESNKESFFSLDIRYVDRTYVYREVFTIFGQFIDVFNSIVKINILLS